MATRDEIRRRRDSAFSANLGIEAGDKIVEMISRRDGLHAISLEKIIRLNMPDDLDPDMEHPDAPTTQTLIFSKGSRSPIVARTILQAKDFSQFLKSKEKQEKITDVAWEVMSSLLAMDRMVRVLRNSIEAKKAEISDNFSNYVVGSSPPPIPIVEELEIDFRSAVLVANHTLNSISELFQAFFEIEFKRGAFDRISRWSNQSFGTGDILTQMLEKDHRWINLWGEVRNAFEHPRDDYYVKVNNFRLLPSRQIQLPTWQLKHSQLLDVFRPQMLIETLEILQANILGLFENLLVVLADKTVRLPTPIALIDKEEKDRNPECPKRYELKLFMPTLQT